MHHLDGGDIQMNDQSW